jgi:hypothetical protein
MANRLNVNSKVLNLKVAVKYATLFYLAAMFLS